MTDAWDEIYQKAREIDEIRKRLPLVTDIDALTSKVVERCVDISRGVAKGMRAEKPELIDFAYIHEKLDKLKDDLEYLGSEIRRTRRPSSFLDEIVRHQRGGRKV